MLLSEEDKYKKLSDDDKACFEAFVGLFRPSPSSPTDYGREYYSDENISYPEGYSPELRVKKYADVLDNIKKLLPPPILDIGCGPGYMLGALRKMGIEVEGVDLSSYAIHYLSDSSVRPYLKNASLRKLPYKDSFFKSGFAFHVFEHLTKEELSISIPEVTRVVEKKLYLIIPTWDSLKESTLYDQIIGDPTHRSIATRDWWVSEFEKSGWFYNDMVSSKLDRLNRGWIFFFER